MSTVEEDVAEMMQNDPAFVGLSGFESRIGKSEPEELTGAAAAATTTTTTIGDTLLFYLRVKASPAFEEAAQAPAVRLSRNPCQVMELKVLLERKSSMAMHDFIMAIKYSISA